MESPVLTFADKYIECLSPMSFVVYVSIMALFFLCFIYFESIEEYVAKAKESVQSFVASTMSVRRWFKLKSKLKEEEIEIDLVPKVKIIDA